MAREGRELVRARRAGKVQFALIATVSAGPRFARARALALDGQLQTRKQHIARDNDGDVVYLTRLQWDIDRVVRDYPDVTLICEGLPGCLAAPPGCSA